MKPRYGHGLPPHQKLYQIIDAQRESYKLMLQFALTLKDKLVTIPEQVNNKDPKSPGWNNGFLPGLDIVMIYSMLAKYKPSTYVEIGSGNSTKLVYKAKRDNNLSTKIISIDPAPRAEIDALADVVVRQPFESTDLSLFSKLKAGDIVFVDNSHRMFPNSDATVFFLDVLPSLPAGVIVHVHDIYLPYDYPQFMCDRFYSEQYGLAAFLLANPDRYQTIMPNYFVSEDAVLRQILEPLWNDAGMPKVEKHGGSYWLEIHQ
ncbi:MAG TPA: class I SAM-dependent methyltransferase [Saprospiraceae bacterium]|nr:class I SAM-dependent methyltransferase [Saprospiraceae bacterium]